MSNCTRIIAMGDTHCGLRPKYRGFEKQRRLSYQRIEEYLDTLADGEYVTGREVADDLGFAASTVGRYGTTTEGQKRNHRIAAGRIYYSEKTGEALRNGTDA